MKLHAKIKMIIGLQIFPNEEKWEQRMPSSLNWNFQALSRCVDEVVGKEYLPPTYFSVYLLTSPLIQITTRHNLTCFTLKKIFISGFWSPGKKSHCFYCSLKLSDIRLQFYFWNGISCRKDWYLTFDPFASTSQVQGSQAYTTQTYHLHSVS
jgi:hypothetical protein